MRKVEVIQCRLCWGTVRGGGGVAAQCHAFGTNLVNFIPSIFKFHLVLPVTHLTERLSIWVGTVTHVARRVGEEC